MLPLPPPPPPPLPPPQETCAICFEPHSVADMCAARCKHYYCKDCWRGYCHTATEGGPACLDLRCPDPACKAVVPRSVVFTVSDDAHRARYEEFELRSFVDDNKGLTWCPAPGAWPVVVVALPAGGGGAAMYGRIG